MPRVTSYQRREVISSSGQRLGSVGAVLFHPSEARVVGLQVDRAARLVVLDRPPQFVLLADAVTEGADTLRVAHEKLPKDSSGERALGYSWQDTVIWRNMPVRSEQGEPVGIVHDASFELSTGVVNSLSVSTGALGDVALGRLEVPGELVAGFDGESVIVRAGYNEIRAEGGAAKVAAAGAAAIKSRAGQVGEGALNVGVAAAGALGRSLRKGVGRKALDTLKSLMEDDE